ncbi:MAG: TonB-dependent receptor [Woeseiaceae bacterium]|nr:TonB-dependent receptor [Woeseiaceae bacterium]
MRFFLLTCALLSTIASPSLASTAASDIDEVIVTASRRPAASADISSALSLVTRDDVLQEKLTTDAISQSIGVSLQQTTPGQGSAVIRGLKGSALLHLVDGMPLSNALFRSAPTPYLALVPTTAVERIEIIRGTSASLYGSQAVGGVIEVVSREPNFATDKTALRRDLALSFDTAELQKSIKGSVDFGNRRLAAILSGEYLTTGDRRIGGGKRISPSGYSSKAARLAVSMVPSDERSWLFDLQWLEQPSTPRIDELVPGFGQLTPSSSEYFFSPNSRLFAHLRHTADDSLFGLDWRIDGAWQQITDDIITRDYEAPTRHQEANSSDLYALSINTTSRNAAISWLAGADFRTDEVKSSRRQVDIQTMVASAVAPRYPSGSRVDEVAMFGNLVWAAADRHQLSGGLRLSDVHIDVPASNLNMAASVDVRRLSGDLGWIYSLSDTWQLVANAGFGFRAPNIADIGTLGNRPGNRYNIPNSDLKEERVEQFDLGVRQQSDAVQFELVFYALRFYDRITSVLTGDTTASGRDIVQSVNAAETAIHGAEASLTFALREAVRARAVLNYTWGSETIGSGGAQPADRIPPLSGELSLDVDLNTAWQWQSWLTVSGPQDRLNDREIRDVRINPDGTPGWTIVGTEVSCQLSEEWRINLMADNLFDKNYRVHGSGLDSPGRNFSITLRRRW